MKWPVTTLGAVAKWGSGGTPKRSEAGYFGAGIPWLSISDLNDGEVTDAKESLTQLGIENSTAKVVPPGTLLVAMYGSIGKLGIAGRELCTSQAIAFARPDPQMIDARYLFHFLLSERARLQRFGRGGTQMNIGQADLKSWPISLPPLGEQRRIAAILDAASELRAKRRASLAQLDSLAESIFLDMFGRGRVAPVTVSQGRMDHPGGWRWEVLTDIARLATGHTPDREVPEYWDGDIPWISLTEIRRLDGEVAKDTDLRVSQAGIDHSSSVILPTGTVCFSRTASIGFVTVMGRPMATSQDFVNWVCGDRLRPLYLMHALLRSREPLRALSTGSTHKTIYMRIAEQFRVLVPPLALQDDFVTSVGDVTRQSRRAANSGTTLDELFASIQHRAFRGEL